MSETEKVEVPNTAPPKKKEKRVMTPEKLEQLAKARHRALEIRQAGASLKEEQKQLADAALEEKLQRERELNEAVKASLLKNEINNDKLHTVPLYRNHVVPELQRSVTHETQRVWDASHEEEEEEEEQPILIKKKIKKPIKTRIIVEQSSDDCDDYESSDRVIFVKRKSKNDSIKKVPATTPVPPNTPEQPLGKVAPNERAWDASHRQLPNVPLPNSMDDFINAGFSNYRKYY